MLGQEYYIAVFLFGEYQPNSCLAKTLCIDPFDVDCFVFECDVSSCLFFMKGPMLEYTLQCLNSHVDAHHTHSHLTFHLAFGRTNLKRFFCSCRARQMCRLDDISYINSYLFLSSKNISTSRVYLQCICHQYIHFLPRLTFLDEKGPT